MAVTLGTITVTNKELAEELMSVGKQLVQLGMTLRDQGFDVPIGYTQDHQADA